MRPEPAHDGLFSPNLLLEQEMLVPCSRRGHYRQVLGTIDAHGEGVFV
jgi:hypothetical protein